MRGSTGQPGESQVNDIILFTCVFCLSLYIFIYFGVVVFLFCFSVIVLAPKDICRAFESYVCLVKCIVTLGENKYRDNEVAIHCSEGY